MGGCRGPCHHCTVNKPRRGCPVSVSGSAKRWRRQNHLRAARVCWRRQFLDQAPSPARHGASAPPAHRRIPALPAHACTEERLLRITHTCRCSSHDLSADHTTCARLQRSERGGRAPDSVRAGRPGGPGAAGEAQHCQKGGWPVPEPVSVRTCERGNESLGNPSFSNKWHLITSTKWPQIVTGSGHAQGSPRRGPRGRRAARGACRARGDARSLT